VKTDETTPASATVDKMPGVSRRRFLKNFAATAAAYSLSSRAFPAQQKRPSIIVIGAGAFGGWTALYLLRKGARVLLVDAWGPGNSRASSGGETRVIRATYGGSRLYTKMAADALHLWRENEKRWHRNLFTRTGVIWMPGRDDAYERTSLATLKEVGVPFDRLTNQEATRRWPQIDFQGVPWLIHEPEAGFLLARSSCQAVFESFLREGGEYRQAKVAPGPISGKQLENIFANNDRIVAQQYVFACGPWLPNVFPFLAKVIKASRQEIFFFGTPAGDRRFTEEEIPVWIDHGNPTFYGIPGNQWRGFKIADDTRGPDFDPTSADRQVSEQGLASVREYLAMRFPGLKSAPLVESRVCQYENSADQDFILDQHPVAKNVWILGGGSGHGFKHGPKIGDMASDAVLGNQTPPLEFRLARFKAELD